MKEKTADIDILEETKDILFEIDMKLYDEFNDKFCEIEENLGTVYSYKDLEDLKKAESDTERRLLREAISNLISENKELKEENKELKEFKENIEKIDRKQLDKLYEDAQKALKEYRETQNKVAKLEEENKELKETIKNNIILVKDENGNYEELNINITDYIPKSKLKAKIEEVEQWGLYNMKIPKLSTLDERLGAKIGIKYILQSLLGKE